MLAFGVFLVFAVGSLIGFMRVWARDGEQWPRPYAMGALVGITAVMVQLGNSGIESWWLLPVWPLLGLYGGGAVGMAGGAVGNVLAGLSNARRESERAWPHRRIR